MRLDTLPRGFAWRGDGLWGAVSRHDRPTTKRIPRRILRTPFDARIPATATTWQPQAFDCSPGDPTTRASSQGCRGAMGPILKWSERANTFRQLGEGEYPPP